MKKITLTDILFLLFAVIYLFSLSFSSSGFLKYSAIVLIGVWLAMFVYKLIILVRSGENK